MREQYQHYSREREKPSAGNLIYGLRPVIEAINAGKEIDKLLIQKGLQGELFHELFQLVRENNILFQYVPVEKLNRMVTKNHQGIVAFISEISYHKIENILPMLYEEGKTPLLLILDRITDVRNFGAIARTAECSGVNAIIVPDKGSAQANADAMKTSAGALNKIPVCRSSNLKDTIVYLKNSGVQVVAATEKAPNYYYKSEYSLPTAFILGSEDEGISPEYLRIADVLVKIPLAGEIKSLNVSVAAGVILYEAVKQRSSDVSDDQ